MRDLTLMTGQWGDLPLKEICGIARDAGLDGLELAINRNHFDLDRASSPAYREELLETLDAYGLKCYAVCGGVVGQCVGDAYDPRLDNFAPERYAGKPEECRRSCSHHDSEFCRFRAAYRQQSGKSVVAIAGSVGYARADRKHVLERSGELHAHHVVIEIDSEFVCREKVCHCQSGFLLAGRHRHACRDSDAYLLGVRRTADADISVKIEVFADDLGHPLVSLLLETLGDAGDDGILADIRGRRLDGASYVLRRKGKDHEVRVLQSFFICLAEMVVTL